MQSYRDLPLLLNQWANVVRWEMRTRIFLRTSEFLWQEGHTAHTTKKEAKEETHTILDIYAKFAEEWMALPVVKGRKTASERFAGADDTLCIEALMQDGKALQAGTSHFLGQNFAKAFDVKFQSKEGTLEYVWGTSWGVSTRLMGALVMAHSDDRGLVLPPKLAPIQVVIVPIYKGEEQLAEITKIIKPMMDELKALGVILKYDNDDQRPGWKFAEYELKGVPLRVAVGMRDLDKGLIEITRRDDLSKEQKPLEGSATYIKGLLAIIQENILKKAIDFKKDNTFEVNTWEEFKSKLEDGGFLSSHWDGTSETEDKIKELTKATIRCIPLGAKEESGKCILTGNPSSQRVLFAKAY
ncbi:MAG: prolyl-tRNA synthetase [Arcticibacterium sp.]